MFYLCFLVFLQKLCNKLKSPKLIRDFLSNLRFNYVEKKIVKYLDESKSKLIKNDKYVSANSNIIWMFWWQGENSMPPLVKTCIDSVKRHSNDKDFVLITKDNFNQYTNISDLIIDKFQNGKISITHLSDILRFNLLYNYGGLWIDATVYCTSEIDNSFFNSIYTSGGYSGVNPKFVDGRWTGFLIGGSAKNELFSFMNYFFEAYWRHNNRLIDYFLIDYALEYAYRNNLGGFKDYVDVEAIDNNPNLFNLERIMNNEYDEKIFNYLKSDTTMFKLSYKLKFKKDNNTFYDKIIH